jgi:tetratricopeptide (TPR) repeat protein
MKYFLNMILLFSFVSVNHSFCQSSGTSAVDDLTRARELFKEKKYDESKALLQKIIDKNGKQAEPHYILSRVFYVENDVDDAEDEAERAVKLAADSAEYHYWLGVCYGRDAQNASIFRKPFLAKDVKNEFEKAIELNPNHIGAHSGLAQYYLFAPGIMGGDENKAVEQANIVLKLDEIRGRMLFIQIYSHQKKNDQTDKEFSILEKKIGDEPKYYSFYNMYGYFLLNEGRVDDAIEKFRKQVALVPNDANAHDSLGEGLMKKGLLKESLVEYNRALEIDPSLKNSQEKAKQIKKMMENEGRN